MMSRAIARAAAVGCLLVASRAQCQEAAPVLDASLTVSAVSDYRYRGVSLSDRDPALQAQLTLAHGSGVYVSGWASSIADNGGGDIETQVAVGYSATAGSLTIDTWGAYYLYPGASQDDFGELSAKVTRIFGKAAVGLLASYAPPQKNIGGTDNLYLGIDGRIELPGTPLALKASAGWEDGAFADDKLDWSFGLEGAVGGLDCALSYVGASRTFGDVNANDTVLLSLSKRF